MTSRDRVLAVIHLSEADRTPVDFSANPVVLQRLCRERNCKTYRQLLECLEVDILDLRGVVDPYYIGPIPEKRPLPGGVTENYWGWRTKVMPTATGEEIGYCDFVLRECTTVEELAAHTWPEVDWFDFSDFASRLEEWKGYAVMASGPSVWQHPSFLRSLDQLLMDLVAAPDIAAYLLDTFTDFYIRYFDRMFTVAPGRIDILRIADDVGMQDRLLISPALFDQFLIPRLRRIIEMAHSHGIKVMFHSCGAIFPLIEKLIAAGVDILDPIQVSARGMDPFLLKKRFGSRLCMHGAMDTQYLLPKGRPEDVRQTAQKMIRILGEKGGYILAPSHVLQSDVPMENILAMYKDVERRQQVTNKHFPNPSETL